MTYHQLTLEDRCTISALRMQGRSSAAIARQVSCHRSSVGRELKRNSSRWDGHYRPSKAQERTNGRRSRSRRNSRFSAQQYRRLSGLLREQQWSPEQMAGYLKKENEFSISHETIYRHIWRDKTAGGSLYRHLRCAQKQRRKRYRAYDSRGRLAGKRPLCERPAEGGKRERIGHWEIDTVMGCSSEKHCIVSLVERTSGYVLIGKLKRRTTPALNRRTKRLIKQHAGCFETITADNGTEFHDYEAIERATGVRFYFATPYHSWERGSNENANGLIRQ